MEDKLLKKYLTELSSFLEFCNKSIIKGSYGSEYYSDQNAGQIMSRARSLLTRITGTSSEEYKQFLFTLKEITDYNVRTKSLIGIMEGLYDDLKNDRFLSIIESIHADLFTDYLVLAQELYETNFLLPAALITGVTLETHLKKLWEKYESGINESIPHKADLINSDLRKKGAYDKSIQKNVTAWLGIRNDAAHNNEFVSKYNKQAINLYIANIQNFISLYPA